MLNKKRNNTHVCSFNLLLEKRRSEKLQIDVVTNKKKDGGREATSPIRG